MDTSAGKKRDFSRKRKRFAVKVSLLKESTLSFEHIPGISPVMTKSCYVQVDASYSLVTRREDSTAGKYFQQWLAGNWRAIGDAPLAREHPFFSIEREQRRKPAVELLRAALQVAEEFVVVDCAEDGLHLLVAPESDFPEEVVVVLSP